MTAYPVNHLTADDLDAFHSGASSSSARLHLETCSACRELVVHDANVIAALSRLEPLAPGPELADRVMARVTITPPAAVPVLSFPVLTRRRAAALVALAAMLVLSVAWSALNRAALEAWLGGAAAELARSGWLAVRAVAATVADQPWFEAVRSAWVAPFKLAAGVAIGLLAYGSALFALRRLVTASGGPVSNANA